MLKLTRKTEYALIALRHLRFIGKEHVVSSKEIANQYNIPKPLLSKVLQDLARQNFIEPIFIMQGPLPLTNHLIGLGKCRRHGSVKRISRIDRLKPARYLFEVSFGAKVRVVQKIYFKIESEPDFI